MSLAPKDDKVKANTAALHSLLSLENEAFAAKDLVTLRHIAVNRPRGLMGSGHIFWIGRKGKKINIEAMTSQPSLDKTTPFIQWITRQLKQQARDNNLDTLTQWNIDTRQDETPFTYPYMNALYVPLAPKAKAGGLLFTRERAFAPQDEHLARRLAKVFGMSAALSRRKRRKKIGLNKRLTLGSSLVLFGLLMAAPVPMTSLAPAEIIAGNPYIITAPFDGVIEDILVPPNIRVEKDMPILRFVDTSYRNEFILAGKEKSIAEAKLRKAAVSSFLSDSAKRDIAIAEAEKDLAQARQDYARERLAKVIITSPKEGLAIYSDPAEWEGRHVTTGEIIIEIANPSELRLRIDAPLSMGESLTDGARVKLFLDNAPLDTLEAELSSASYYAKETASGQMSYEAYAELKLTNGQVLPRIGARGVAKIYGKKAPLGYWLLRRPITLIRQSLGL